MSKFDIARQKQQVKTDHVLETERTRKAFPLLSPSLLTSLVGGASVRQSDPGLSSGICSMIDLLHPCYLALKHPINQSMN